MNFLSRASAKAMYAALHTPSLQDDAESSQFYRSAMDLGNV